MRTTIVTAAIAWRYPRLANVDVRASASAASSWRCCRSSHRRTRTAFCTAPTPQFSGARSANLGTTLCRTAYLSSDAPCGPAHDGAGCPRFGAPCPRAALSSAPHCRDPTLSRSKHCSAAYRWCSPPGSTRRDGPSLMGRTYLPGGACRALVTSDKL